MSEWIKCSDKLPEVCDPVLVYLKNLGCCVCYITDPFEIHMWTLVDHDEFEQWFHFDEITHWMPLPERPND